MYRRAKGFVAGGLIGALGGLVGLGGAEFRLPVLVGMFRLETLEAVVLNKAMSLVVVSVALLFRLGEVPPEVLLAELGIAVNLLLGSLIGAWWAAGHVLRMPRQWLDRGIMLLLVGLGAVMLAEAWHGVAGGGGPLIEHAVGRFVAGWLAGLFIGMVAAFLGVAGGELLIPTLVVLYGVDIKLAGSLSLVVSLPTMIVGFARYARSTAFGVIERERGLFGWMSAGSILGAALGGLALGLVEPRLLMGVLGVILLVSAVKTFHHRH